MTKLKPILGRCASISSSSSEEAVYVYLTLCSSIWLTFFLSTLVSISFSHFHPILIFSLFLSYKLPTGLNVCYPLCTSSLSNVFSILLCLPISPLTWGSDWYQKEGSILLRPCKMTFFAQRQFIAAFSDTPQSKENQGRSFYIIPVFDLCYLCCMVYFNGGIINHRYCRFQFCGVMQMAFISRSIDFSVFLMGDFNGQLVKSAVCTTALHHGAKHKDIKGNIDKWNRSTQICISFLSNF